jgi:hypothetical protein
MQTSKQERIRPLVALVAAGVVALVLCAITVETWRAHSGLAGEVASLRVAVGELPRLKEEITRLSQSRDDGGGFSRSVADQHLLAQLRKEVALLKQRLAELTNSPALVGQPAAIAPLSLSQEAWTNAGSVTWPSALQTFMWAVRGGDYSTLKELAWSTPDQRFEKHTGLLTDLVSRSQAIRFGVPKYTRADGLDTLNADWATTVHIDVMFDQGANEAPRFHEVKFTRLGDGWKCSF